MSDLIMNYGCGVAVGQRTPSLGHLNASYRLQLSYDWCSSGVVARHLFPVLLLKKTPRRALLLKYCCYGRVCAFFHFFCFLVVRTG